MSLSKWRERGVALFVGLLATLLLLEGGLRAVGWVTGRVTRSEVPGRAAGTYTILCLGDSFTEGYWALKPYESYPAQLEQVFASALGTDKVRVVNRGQSGQNTYQLLSRLDADLAEVQPDAVVVLAGGANQWDLFNYYRYCDGNSLSSRLKDSLYRVRVFRLIKLLGRDLGIGGPPSRQMDNAIFTVPGYSVKYLHTMRQTTLEGQRSYDRGVAFWSPSGQIRRRDVPQAESCFRDALKCDPGSLGAWVNLGWLREVQGDAEGAVSCFLKVYEINARALPSLAARQASTQIVACLRGSLLAHPEWRDMFLDRFRALAPSCPEARQDCESLSKSIGSSAEFEEKVRAWILSDIVKIIERCQEKGAVVVLQDYPRYAPDSSWAWESILPALAEENGALFVYQCKAFDALPNRERYFADDRSHPNVDGNHFMAETIYRCLAPLVPTATRGAEVTGSPPAR